MGTQTPTSTKTLADWRERALKAEAQLAICRQREERIRDLLPPQSGRDKHPTAAMGDIA